MSIKTAPSQFIIIDDDPISNLLCRISIKSYFKDSTILTFSFPEQGFEYIASEYSQSSSLLPIILFLDINMPIWSGWDFLEHFEKLRNLKASFKIYIMSSSIDANDVARADANKNVIDYIKKPFNRACLVKISEDYLKESQDSAV
ncbi:MAG TPA: response regulator [Pedobacter sp.]|uniref:response regulator n=1 Tax=Pedobacter sp. TaxID=1411316 RepID=UPI002C7ECFB0|nr:response regulator [Pedobacter sp.]HMI02124.1 response regulator [Pedobacter sp.]